MGAGHGESACGGGGRVIVGGAGRVKHTCEVVRVAMHGAPASGQDAGEVGFRAVGECGGAQIHVRRQAFVLNPSNRQSA